MKSRPKGSSLRTTTKSPTPTAMRTITNTVPPVDRGTGAGLDDNGSPMLLGRFVVIGCHRSEVSGVSAGTPRTGCDASTRTNGV